MKQKRDSIGVALRTTATPRHTNAITPLHAAIDYFDIIVIALFRSSSLPSSHFLDEEGIASIDLLHPLHLRNYPKILMQMHVKNTKVLAVKMIYPSLFNGGPPDEFSQLVSNICKLHQPNIAELVGYCSEHAYMLVYEYFRNGSLHEFLHLSDDFSKPLTWNTRVKIALGTALAIEYLHEICSPSLVHKNIKSSNILLDTDLNLMSRTMVLHPSTSSKPKPEQCLVRWATPQLHDITALEKMVDLALREFYPPKSLCRFAIIALCVPGSHEPTTSYVLSPNFSHPCQRWFTHWCD